MSETTSDLDAWDPMKNSFEQKSFNSYHMQNYNDDFTEKHVPLANGDTISPTKGSYEGVELFVSNIPLSLTENALRNMFSSVGECKSVRRIVQRDSAKDTTIGFVVYDSVRLAELAIQKFNNFVFGDKYQLRVRLSHQKNGQKLIGKNKIIWRGDVNLDDSSGFEDLVEVEGEKNHFKNNVDKNCIENVTNDHKDVVPEQVSVVTKETISGFPVFSSQPRLYIQGIKVGTDNIELKQLFDQVGPTSNCIVVPQKTPSQSTTYGFVSYDTFEEADTAIDRFHNFKYNGYNLAVSYSTQSSSHKKLSEDENFYHLLHENSDPFEDTDTIEDPNIVDTSFDTELVTGSPAVSITSNKDRRSISESSLLPIVRSKDVCAYCLLPHPQKRCSRCKIRYCNRSCQSNDWLAHKVTCEMSATKKHSSLPESAPMVTKTFCHLSMLPLREKLTGDVFIMFPVFDENFCVSGIVCCDAQKNYTRQLIDIEMEMQKSAFQPNIPAENVEEGLLCIAKYSQDSYGRAVVLVSPKFCKTEDSYVELKFIDHDLKCDVQIKDLIHLPEKYWQLPAQGGYFGLESLSDKVVSRNELGLLNELNNCFKDKYLKITFNDLDPLDKNVFLTDIDDDIGVVNNYILNKFIATETMTSARLSSSCSDAIRGLMLEDLPSRPFPDDDELDVCFTEVVTPHFFYGQLTSDVEMLQSLSANLLNDYGSSDMTIFTPKVNEICVVKFNADQCWYRAVVLHYNSDLTARVFFIDYGNKADVDPENICCINESLLNYPKLAIKFKLHNFEPLNADGKWGEETIDVLRLQLMESVLKIRCVSQEEDFMICDIVHNGTSLSNTLKLQGLASSKQFLTKDLPKRKIIFNTTEPFDAIGVDVKSPLRFHAWVGDLNASQEQVQAIARGLSLQADREAVYCPLVGELVAAFHREYQEWYRANVLNFSNEKAVVELIDYGSQIEVDLKDLSELPNNDIYKEPAHAVRLCLDCADTLPNNDVKLEELFKSRVEFKKGKCFYSKLVNDVIFVRWRGEDGKYMEETLKSFNGERSMNSDVGEFILKSDSFNVLLTHVESPSLFHGQLAEKESIESVMNLTRELETYVTNNQPPVSYQPKVEELCAGLHEEYKEWYRVLVKSVVNDKAIVELIDYGETLEMNVNKLRPLIKRMTALPRQAIKMSLNNISPYQGENWSSDCCDKLKEYCLKCVSVTTISVNDTVKVDLKAGEIDISNLLVSNNLAIWTSSIKCRETTSSPKNKICVGVSKSSTTGRIMYEDFPRHVIDASKLDVVVVNVDSPSSFQCQLADADLIAEVDRLNSQMTNQLLEEFSQYTPIVGECCAAYFQLYDMFFRVRVTDITGDKAYVTSIDYGNKAIVFLQDIKPLPKEYSTMKMQALDMCLHNTQGSLVNGLWSEEATNYFTKTYLNQLCSALIKENAPDQLYVELFHDNNSDVTSDLIAKGYAIATNGTFSKSTLSSLSYFKDKSPVLQQQFACEKSIDINEEKHINHSRNSSILTDSGTPLEPHLSSSIHFEDESLALQQQFACEKSIDINEEKHINLSRNSSILTDSGTPLEPHLSSSIHFEDESLALQQQFACEKSIDINEEKHINLSRNSSILTDSGTPLEPHLSSSIHFEDESLALQQQFADEKSIDSNEEKHINLSRNSSILTDSGTPLEPHLSSSIHFEDESLALQQQFADEKSIDINEEKHINLSRNSSILTDSGTPLEPHLSSSIHFEDESLALQQQFADEKSIDSNEEKHINLSRNSSILTEPGTPLEPHLSSSIHFEDESLALQQQFADEKSIDSNEEKHINLSRNISILTEPGTPLEPHLSSSIHFEDESLALQQQFAEEKHINLSRNSSILTDPGPQIDKYTSLPLHQLESGSEIIVSHIKSIECFYAQPFDKKLDNLLAQLTLDISKYCKEHPEGRYRPVAGSLCCALDTGFWYRAYVKDVESTGANVFFVDYGNERFATHQELRPFSNDFLQLPAIAMCMKLCNPKNIPSSSPVVDAFGSEVLNESCIVTIVKRDMDCIEVELAVTSTGNNVIQKLEQVLIQEKPLDKNDGRVQHIKKNLDQHQENVMSKKSIVEGLTVNNSESLSVNSFSETVQFLKHNSNVLENAQLNTSAPANEFDYKDVLLPVTDFSLDTPNFFAGEENKKLGPKSKLFSAFETTNEPNGDYVEGLLLPTAESGMTVTTANHIPNNTTSKLEMKNQNISSNPIPAGRLSTRRYTVSSLSPEIHPLALVSLRMDVVTVNTNKSFKTFVTHTVDPYLTYGVIADSDRLKAVEDIAAGIASYVVLMKPSETFYLKSGTLCTVMDSKNRWRRAVVTDVTDTCATVFLMDFGHSFKYPHQDIKPLPKRFKALSAQVIPLNLTTVKPVGGDNVWSDEAIDFYRGVVDGRTLRVKIEFKQGPFFAVRMKLDRSGELVESIMKQEGYADLLELEKVSKEETLKNKKSLNLNRGDVPLDYVIREIPIEKPSGNSFEVLVTCVVSPRLFFAQLYTKVNTCQVNNINEALKELFEKGKLEDNYEPTVGKLCSVSEKNLWYRGFVLDVRPNAHVVVYLIDYGFKHTVPTENVRRLPKKFVNEMPSQALSMQLQHVVPLDNAEEYSDDTSAYFKSLIQFKRMEVQVSKIQGFVYGVRVVDPVTNMDIGEQLVEEGYASSLFSNSRGQIENQGICGRGNPIYSMRGIHDNRLPRRGFPLKQSTLLGPVNDRSQYYNSPSGSFKDTRTQLVHKKRYDKRVPDHSDELHSKHFADSAEDKVSQFSLSEKLDQRFVGQRKMEMFGGRSRQSPNHMLSNYDGLPHERNPSVNHKSSVQDRELISTPSRNEQGEIGLGRGVILKERPRLFHATPERSDISVIRRSSSSTGIVKQTNQLSALSHKEYHERMSQTRRTVPQPRGKLYAPYDHEYDLYNREYNGPYDREYDGPYDHEYDDFYNPEYDKYGGICYENECNYKGRSHDDALRDYHHQRYYPR